MRRKTVRLYRLTAIVVLNTMILLVSINLVLMVVFAIADHQPNLRATNGPRSPDGYFYRNGTAVDNGKRTPSNLAVFDYTAYEGAMSELEISEMLSEFYDQHREGFEYQAYSQYGPREYAGKYLNVDIQPNGLAIRRTVNPPADDAGRRTIKVFTFGGSTTFGAGLPDEHTWPTYLSQLLNAKAREANLDVRVEVTNYGRVGFYPTQELHQLMEVLRAGERPDLVIFLDGLNAGRADDTPGLTTDYIRAIDEAQRPGAARWRWIPMVRAANAAQRLSARTGEADTQTPDDRHQVEMTIARFLQFRENTLAISTVYDFQSIFILQPDAHYNYPAHLYGLGRLPIRAEARAFKERFYAQFPKESGFVDLTGLFRAWGDRKAIVDTGHYSPNFSRFLAENIAGQIDVSAIESKRRGKVMATGIARRR